MEWGRLRQKNLRKMIEIAKTLLVMDLSSSINSKKDHPAESPAIIATVRRISNLYAETIIFERQNHAVEPPEGLERLHALQFGWTAPIRDGVHQVFEFLDSLIELDTRKKEKVDFTITFGSPPNVDRYCDELDRLSRQLPADIMGE